MWMPDVCSNFSFLRLPPFDVRIINKVDANSAYNNVRMRSHWCTFTKVTQKGNTHALCVATWIKSDKLIERKGKIKDDNVFPGKYKQFFTRLFYGFELAVEPLVPPSVLVWSEGDGHLVADAGVSEIHFKTQIDFPTNISIFLVRQLEWGDRCCVPAVYPALLECPKRWDDEVVSPGGGVAAERAARLQLRDAQKKQN